MRCDAKIPQARLKKHPSAIDQLLTMLIADPRRRTVEAHEWAEAVSYLDEHDVLRSNAFPSLTIELRDIFELDEPA